MTLPLRLQLVTVVADIWTETDSNVRVCILSSDNVCARRLLWDSYILIASGYMNKSAMPFGQFHVDRLQSWICYMFNISRFCYDHVLA